ncbi:hypothetical protein ACFRCI_34250 [Streptomyces sp. NPDC056638]|uniref:hypothetical protein n=1 Tax=Streptomyces sp. NPDC056638 TaxID=3345887 RepID=UPI00368EFEC0
MRHPDKGQIQVRQRRARSPFVFSAGRSFPVASRAEVAGGARSASSVVHQPDGFDSGKNPPRVVGAVNALEPAELFGVGLGEVSLLGTHVHERSGQ